MEETKKTQWHPAFCSAVKLELTENKRDLSYNSEYNLNTKPISIDLLVIRKSPDVIINNEIGKIFKGHNIFEYKSPDNNMDIDTFYKGIAYASLYKAGGSTVDKIKADDITISFVRYAKPVKLLNQLKQSGMTIINAYQGVYYISSQLQFDIQIIVSSELTREEHIWLCSLSNNLTNKEAKIIVNKLSSFSEKDDLDYIDSVLNVVISRNFNIFNEMKEDDSMCEPLKKLFQPELDEAVAKKDAEIEAVKAEKDAIAAEKDAIVAEKDAEIAALKAQLKNI